MKSLDANIVLRMLLQDNVEQAAQIHTMLEAAGVNDFVVADVVIFEAVWVMQGQRYELDRPMVAHLLSKVTDIDQLNCNRVMIERVVPLYLKYPGVSFIDLALAVYADLNDATPLLTYDKKLAKALPELVQVL